ncbi:MAG: winged helix DNA-binding domain-containing protein, partial [Clostridia bacterium]|nr:winged helix DNA-binding domain-containing protein [Clostridia bacterium]
APLDNMMWDRDLIKELFGFAYKWEIYTPKSQRQYGSYVLPILYGERFVGRIEMAFDKKSRELRVLHLWYEPDVQPDKDMEEAIRAATGRFERWRKDESD